MDRVLASEAKDGSSILPGATLKGRGTVLKTTTLNTVVNTKTSDLTLVCRSQKHAFHILEASPYPFLVSLFLLSLLIPTTLYMHALDLPFGLPRADLIHISFLGLYLTAMS
jgi:hypothetical protein